MSRDLSTLEILGNATDEEIAAVVLALVALTVRERHMAPSDPRRWRSPLSADPLHGGGWTGPARRLVERPSWRRGR